MTWGMDWDGDDLILDATVVEDPCPGQGVDATVVGGEDLILDAQVVEDDDLILGQDDFDDPPEGDPAAGLKRAGNAGIYEGLDEDGEPPMPVFVVLAASASLTALAALAGTADRFFEGAGSAGAL